MIKPRDCPVCGGPIMFTYVRPDFIFYIDEDGEINRDSNQDLWHGKDPFLKFHCGNDMTHNLEEIQLMDPTTSSQSDWEEAVEEEFYQKIFPEL